MMKKGAAHHPCTSGTGPSHLVLGYPLPANADWGDVGGELSSVVNLSVVLQGRDTSSVDVHDGVQGAVVPRLQWQSDVGVPVESKRRR